MIFVKGTFRPSYQLINGIGRVASGAAQKPGGRRLQGGHHHVQGK